MSQPNAEKLFTVPDAWGGGTHDLTLVFRQMGDGVLAAAREAIWSFPDLEGCWRRHDKEPARRSRVTAGDTALDARLFGIAHIPGAGRVACGTCLVREDAGLVLLTLLLPVGSLAAVYPLGEYPCDDGSDLAWRDALDRWLRTIAEHVHRTVPFEMALVGWLDGQTGAVSTVPGEVPEERWIGYLVPGPGGLAWHPPNHGAPIDMRDPFVTTP
jgi:hypothetical protein